MVFEIVTYSLIFIYILALIAIGLTDHKNEDRDGFIIADRKVGILGTFASASAGFRTGGGLFMIMGLGFLMGYGIVYSMILGLSIGAIILCIAAPIARKKAKEKGYITINQMIRDTIGVKTEKVSSFIVLIFATLGVAAQFFVLGKITGILLGVDPFNSILISAAVVAIYVSLGGYKSIIKTDILQYAIILSVWLVLLFIPFNFEAASQISTTYTSQTPVEFWAALLYGAVLIFAYADFWQRIFSSRNNKVARISMGLILPSWFVMSLPLTFIGMSARGIISTDTGVNDVFIRILESGLFPPLAISIMTVVGISITMSTLDTYSYVFSSTILENFMRDKVKHSKKKYIYLSKIIMVAMLAIGAVLALTIQDILGYLLNSLSLIIVLSPLFLLTAAGLIKRTTKQLDTLIMWSLIIAFSLGAYLFAQGMLKTFSMRLIAVGISTALMILAYLYVIHKRRIKKWLFLDKVKIKN